MVEVGTRIYNRGDMANPDHFGTVTKIENGNVWIESDNTGLELYPEEPRLSYDRPYTYAVPLSMVNFVDAGNGLTRIVTEAAYNARRAAGIAALYGRAG